MSAIPYITNISPDSLFCKVCSCFLLVLFHCVNSFFEGLGDPSGQVLFRVSFRGRGGGGGQLEESRF